MQLLNRYRYDGNFCPDCGEEIRWTRLESGLWIAVDPEPIYYIPGIGKRWLVESLRWDTVILKDCKIWEPGKGMPTKGVKTGFRPHVFECMCSGFRKKKEVIRT